MNRRAMAGRATIRFILAGRAGTMRINWDAAAVTRFDARRPYPASPKGFGALNG